MKKTAKTTDSHLTSGEQRECFTCLILPWFNLQSDKVLRSNFSVGKVVHGISVVLQNLNILTLYSGYLLLYTRVR